MSLNPNPFFEMTFKKPIRQWAALIALFLFYSDNYNQALGTQDRRQTINGHQFAIVRIAAQWIAVNTSKGEWTPLPAGFTPGSVVPPKNIAVRFASYPGVTFLLRKIGKDGNDDCQDGSLTALMNIYRSGRADNPDFRWDRFQGDAIEGTP